MDLNNLTEKKKKGIYLAKREREREGGNRTEAIIPR